MNLSKQIKELRQQRGMTQEVLAERIYVARQTISNWETEHSYPDVQSLLMLSVLFDVSLDELIKGDVEVMKNELDMYKMNVWAWVMAICFVVSVIAAIPLYDAFGFVGLIPSVALMAVSFAAALVLEKIKKKHNIQTYSEIVAFFEDGATNAEKPAQTTRRKVSSIALRLFCGALVGLAISALAVKLFM